MAIHFQGLSLSVRSILLILFARDAGKDPVAGSGLNSLKSERKFKLTANKARASTMIESELKDKINKNPPEISKVKKHNGTQNKKKITADYT